MMNPRESHHTSLVVLLTIFATTCEAGEPLTNGVLLTDLSGSAGSETFYTFVVPSGQDSLEIRIFGGTGDCDLYIRRGAPPALDVFDYRPYTIGNDETVTVTDPADGTWHIMLRGYSSYAGVTLIATYSVAGPVMRTLTITASEGGSVVVPGEGQFDIKDGTTLAIQAVPADSEHAFMTWSGTAVDGDRVEDPNAASTAVLVDGDYSPPGSVSRAARRASAGLLARRDRGPRTSRNTTIASRRTTRRRSPLSSGLPT